MIQNTVLHLICNAYLDLSKIRMEGLHLCSDVILFLEKGKFRAAVNVVCLITCRHTWCYWLGFVNSHIPVKTSHHMCLGVFAVWMFDSQPHASEGTCHVFQMLSCVSLIGPRSQDSSLLRNISSALQ